MDFKYFTFFVLCCIQGCNLESSQPDQPPPKVESEEKPKVSGETINGLLEKGMSVEKTYDVLNAEPTEFLRMSMNRLEVTVTSPKYPNMYINLFFWADQLDSWSMVPLE